MGTAAGEGGVRPEQRFDNALAAAAGWRADALLYLGYRRQLRIAHAERMEAIAAAVVEAADGDRICPLCGWPDDSHAPGCDGDDYDPPQKCEECGGRITYGSINACLGCQGRGWT